MLILQTLIYCAAIVFIVGMIVRILRIAKSPLHLRWELYPVPHVKQKSQYGGSELEDLPWKAEVKKKDILNEVKSTAEEILLLKAVKQANMPLWKATYLFHLGLYAFFANKIIIILSVLINIIFGVDSTNTILSIIAYPVFWIAVLGSMCGIAGSVTLFSRRVSDDGLRKYSTGGHFFDIAIIAFIFITLLRWALSSQTFVADIFQTIKSLLLFTPIPVLPDIAIANFIVVCIFLMYMPFTHLSHMILKYFSYHKMRWDDEIYKPGSSKNKEIIAQLNQEVAWSAPHIAPGETRTTWLDIAKSYNADGIKSKEDNNG